MGSKLLFAAGFLLFTSVVFAQNDQHDEAAHHDHQEHRVNVDVYYESLCPDSKAFITNQLYVSLVNENISKYINLTLIPFGKSEFVSGTEFKCHHGPDECTGNKIQACALGLLNKTEGSGYNKVATAFINCLMKETEKKNGTTEFPTNSCAVKNNVPNVANIVSCSKVEDGTVYLKHYMELTQALKPALKSVPTIVFNGKYSENDNKLAQNNFVKALCQYIQGDKPAECSVNGANSLKFNVAALTVLLAMFHYLY